MYKICLKFDRAAEHLNYAWKFCGSSIAKMEEMGLRYRMSQKFVPDLQELATLYGGEAQVASFYLFLKNNLEEARKSVNDLIVAMPQSPSIHVCTALATQLSHSNSCKHFIPVFKWCSVKQIIIAVTRSFTNGDR